MGEVVNKNLITESFDIIKGAGDVSEKNDDGSSQNLFIRGLVVDAISFNVDDCLFSAHTTEAMRCVEMYQHQGEEINATGTSPKYLKFSRQGIEYNGTSFSSNKILSSFIIQAPEKVEKLLS